MIKVPAKGIHRFKKTNPFTQSDRLESYDKVKCVNCGLIGRLINIRDSFVLVSDTYSDKRIQRCERDNFVDKYLGKKIQTVCKIRGSSEYDDVYIYSYHFIIKPPLNEINGEAGVWVMGKTKPVKILPDEFIFALKPKRKVPAVMVRTKKVKPKPLDWTHYAHIRVRTKTNVRIVPVRTIFKRKRTK
jgi:hypothetical protein